MRCTECEATLDLAGVGRNNLTCSPECIKARRNRLGREATAARPPKPQFVASPAKLRKIAKLVKAAVEATKHNPDSDALRHGADVVNALASNVMAELKAHTEDPESRFHKDALQLMFSRMLPMSFINDVAVRAVRNGEFGCDVEESAPEEAEQVKPPRERKPRGPRGVVVNIIPTFGPLEEAL